MLDGWGGIHPFGGAPVVFGGASFPGWVTVAYSIAARGRGLDQPRGDPIALQPLAHARVDEDQPPGLPAVDELGGCPRGVVDEPVVLGVVADLDVVGNDAGLPRRRSPRPVASATAVAVGGGPSMTEAGPGEYVVERSGVVAVPPADVYALIQDFHQWREWSPWEDLDPNLARTYSGAPAGVGAVYEWSGNRKAGQGRMEITDATSPSELVIQLQFLKPFKATTVTRFRLVDQAGATEVTWTMTGKKTFATRVMGLFMSMDKMLGRDFEKGLDRLRAAAVR